MSAIADKMTLARAKISDIYSQIKIVQDLIAQGDKLLKDTQTNYNKAIDNLNKLDSAANDLKTKADSDVTLQNAVKQIQELISYFKKNLI